MKETGAAIAEGIAPVLMQAGPGSLSKLGTRVDVEVASPDATTHPFSGDDLTAQNTEWGSGVLPPTWPLRLRLSAPSRAPAMRSS
jgi:hypothetical protein